MSSVLVGGYSPDMIADGYAEPQGVFSMTDTEAKSAHPLRVAGTFSHLTVALENYGTNRTLRVRKNGANGNQVVNIADGTEAGTDAVNTDHFNTGDKFNILYTSDTHGDGPYDDLVSSVFTADSGHCAPVGTSQSVLPTSSLTKMPFIFGAGISATEGNVQNTMRTGGTIQNGGATVYTAPNANVVMILRKNGGNGTITFTITSGNTGLFEDTTHTDSFVTGDLLNWSATTTSTVGNGQCFSSITYTGVSNELGGSWGSTNYTTNTTDNQFIGIVGGGHFSVGSEVRSALQHYFSGTSSRLRAKVAPGSTTTQPQPIQFRKNGVNGNQIITIGAGASGLFEDSTHTDSFGPTDLCNIVMPPVASASGAFNVYHWMSTETWSAGTVLSPDADSSDGSWTDQAGGTSLFAAIDEATADDSDYIKSSANPVNDICKIGLSNPTVTVGEPFIVNYRYRKQGTSVVDLTVRLLEGSTEIALWLHSNIGSSFTDAAQTLSSGQFASIGDFTNLFLEFKANAP